MIDPSEDEEKLAAIIGYCEKHHDDCLLDTAEIEFLVALACDGLKWRKAAAHGDDVERLKARIVELEKEKQDAFDLGFRAAGGTITPISELNSRYLGAIPASIPE